MSRPPWRTMKINLVEIRTEGGTQTRAGIDEVVVTEYVEAMEAGDMFPPLTVFHDGTAYWLGDGFHRYHAHAKLEALEVEADVRQGSRRDAVLYSVGANATHGLRRTNEDKRRAVTVLLEDEEWVQWSNNEIAKRAGVSHTFVNRLRSSLETVSSQVPLEDSSSRIRTGADGRTINTANIGRPKAEVSEYTQPRYIKTYSPPLSPDTSEEGENEPPPEEVEDTELVTPPRTFDLVTGEGIIRPDASPELVEAANQPVPLETPDTRMKAALKREGYDDAEKVGKHMAALLGYDEGRLMEIVTGPSGQLLGLSKFHKMLLTELQRKTLTVQS